MFELVDDEGDLVPVPAELTPAGLFRALQNYKRDDLPIIAALLDQTRGAVLDICSGVGRSAKLAHDRGRDVTYLDVDAEALHVLGRRWPGARTTVWDLARAPALEAVATPVQLALCAHHSANEVGRLDTVLATAAAALAPGGLFYLDVLTSDYDRPGTVEPLMEFGRSSLGRWVLHTAVLPHADEWHTLVLIAHHLAPDGTVQRAVTHPLVRRNFPAEHVLEQSDRVGFVLKERIGQNRFVFTR